MKTGLGLEALLRRADRIRSLDLRALDPLVVAEITGTVRALQAELKDRSSDDKRLILETAALVSPHMLDHYKDRRLSAQLSVEYTKMLLEASEERPE